MPRNLRSCRKNQPKDIYTRVKVTGTTTLILPKPKPKRLIQNRNKLCEAAEYLFRELKFIFYRQVPNKKEIIDGKF